jgi:hypothetical protein
VAGNPHLQFLWEDFPVPSCPMQEQPQETTPRGYTMEHYSKAGTLMSGIVKPMSSLTSKNLLDTFTKNLPKPFGYWEITHFQE